MRKQKIWVDSELLKYDDLSLCCTKNFDNTFYTNNYSLIDNEEYFEAYFQSIKTHDRELVKKVCEKIREFCENNKYRCNKYFLLYSIGLNVKLLNKNKEGQKETFYEFLDQIEQEFKDE